MWRVREGIESVRCRDEAEADAGETAAECDFGREEWSDDGEGGEFGAFGAFRAFVVPKVECLLTKKASVH